MYSVCYSSHWISCWLLPDLPDTDTVADADTETDADTDSCISSLCPLSYSLSVWLSGNKYIDSEAPWTLVKTAPRRAETTLYVLLELVRRTAVLLQPFLPPSSAAVLDQLGLSACSRLRSFSSVTSCGTESSNGGSGGSGGSGSLRLSPGASLSTGELVPIFPRCDMNGVIAPKKKTSAK